MPDRTNEKTGKYAEQCVAVAKELGLPSINLWSKMQKTEGWQKKYLRSIIITTVNCPSLHFRAVDHIYVSISFTVMDCI